MIKCTNKFDYKAKNIGFFVNEKLEFRNTINLSSFLNTKILKFLSNNKNNIEKKILSFDLSENQKCFFIIVKKNIITHEINFLGAHLKSLISLDKLTKKITLLGKLNFKIDNFNEESFINEFSYGFELKSYSFEKYLSKKKNINQELELVIKNYKSFKNSYKYLSSIKEGVFLARDLVSEPPNVLFPKKYAEEIKKLTKLGLKVEILNEAKLKKLGMNSLLGVGQGSEKESFLVVVKWNGANKNFGKPLAFVGKGVCFDSGGISIKPSAGMEEMKWDMGGAAVTAAIIKYLSEIGTKAIMQKTENYYLQDNSKFMPEADKPLYFTIEEKSNSIQLTEKGIDTITSSGDDNNFFIVPDIGVDIDKIEKSGKSIEEISQEKEKVIQDYSIKTKRIHTSFLLAATLGYVIFQLFHNDPRESYEAMVLQASIQKLIVLINIICIFIFSFAFESAHETLRKTYLLKFFYHFPKVTSPTTCTFT